jgi:hypothetical protein
MDEERNLGVTEARFALTILTCLLVAIGYIALLRLGGTKDPSADLSSDDSSVPSITGPATPTPTTKAEPSPVVLTLENPADDRNELAKRSKSGQQLAEPARR